MNESLGNINFSSPGNNISLGFSSNGDERYRARSTFSRKAVIPLIFSRLTQLHARLGETSVEWRNFLTLNMHFICITKLRGDYATLARKRLKRRISV